MTAISHKQLFPVFAAASGEGRGSAFRENPCEETRDAILDNLERALNKLIRSAGKSSGKAPAKTTRKAPAKTAAKAKAPAKRAVAKDAGEKTASPLAKKFKVGQRVRVVKRDGDKFVGVIEVKKLKGAKIRLKTGELEYGRFTQMTVLGG
jgi:hypothetical protein